MQEHLSSMKAENNFLRDQNGNLNHDIQALLHVIHHARSTGHWEVEALFLAIMKSLYQIYVIIFSCVTYDNLLLESVSYLWCKTFSMLCL